MSVSLLDFYLDNLKFREDWTKAEEHLFLTASSYLAVLSTTTLENIWPESEISIDFEDGEIKLNFKLGKQTQTTRVSHHLKELYQKPPQEIPYFKDYKYQLEPSTRLTRVFACGLFTAQSPYSDGFMPELGPDEFMQASKLLSESCSHYYKNNFTEEKFGQNSNLYFTGLTLPTSPLRDMVLFDSASKVSEFLKPFNPNTKELFQLGFNLNKTPDELTSLHGKSLAYNSFYKLADHSVKGLVAGMLSAYPKAWTEMAEITGKGLFEPHISFGPRKNPSETKELIASESFFGLGTKALFQEEKFEDEDYFELYKLIRNKEWALAKDKVGHFLDSGRATTALVLQGIEVDLWRGDLEQAASDLSQLNQESFGDNKDLRTWHMELTAELCDLSETTDIFLALYDTCKTHDLFSTRIAIPIARGFLKLNQPEVALELANRALELEDKNPSALVFKYLSERLLGANEEALKTLNSLYSLYPFDSRVFSLVQAGLSESNDLVTSPK